LLEQHEASAFAARVARLLERVEYRRADSSQDKEAIFRMRYEAYAREGFIEPNGSGLFTDADDECPNAWLIAVFIDGALASSIRLHIASRPDQFLPVSKGFPDIIMPRLEAGDLIIDASRQTSRIEFTRTYPFLPYITMRSAFIAEDHLGGDFITAACRPEYRAAEIFIPVENPAREADARRFADTVIKQLRAGAPFPVVAAQFSQSQSALEGGDLGWVQPSQLDPGVAQVVQQMPPGAVSEPIAVPGGIAIVHLIAKRLIGRDVATVLSMREVFLPFATPLVPAAPTPQQIATLKRAQAISASVRSCPDMEQVAKENPSPRPVDPGPVRLDSVNPPAFRAMLASQSLDHATKPLVAQDGIAVMIICSRDEKNLDQITKQQVQEQILQTRVELLSRQMQQDLRRKARILQRGEPGGLTVASQN